MAILSLDVLIKKKILIIVIIIITARAPTCSAKVDVGFILDSSGSLRNDYHNEKKFLNALVNAFGISREGSRAGVVTFSLRAEHSIKVCVNSLDFQIGVKILPKMINGEGV